MTEPGLIVALDFGGTKMAAGVADADGQILDTATIPTKPADGADRAMQRILDAAAGLSRRGQGAGPSDPLVMSLWTFGSRFTRCGEGVRGRRNRRRSG